MYFLQVTQLQIHQFMLVYFCLAYSAMTTGMRSPTPFSLMASIEK